VANIASNPDRQRGVVFDIQRFSIHDGPGIRDLIFLKGCSLRCRWCSNPESQNLVPEIGFNESRCIGSADCGRCIPVCPVSAISANAGGKIGIDRKLCDNCGKCVAICPARAIRMYGENMTVDEILKTVEEDGPFYRRSGGGITVSGGEALCQPDFARELLKTCRARGIDTAVETTGFGKWEDVEKICLFANLILYDIKHLDTNKHKSFIGVGNEMVLENLRHLDRALPNTPVIVRTPVIPGFNDTEKDIRAIADFLIPIRSVTKYQLLPYHRFGESKYRQLDREYPMSELRSPGHEVMAALGRIAETVALDRENKRHLQEFLLQIESGQACKRL